MILLNIIDPEGNFWELNKEMKLLFPDLEYNKETSDLMWAIALIYHPDSVFAQESLKDRITLIQDQYLDENFDPVDYREIIDIFRRHLLTRKQRSLQVWGDKLDERDAFMNGLPYNEDNMNVLETLLKNNKTIHDSYDAAEKAAKKEAEDMTFGNVTESATDKKQI